MNSPHRVSGTQYDVVMSALPNDVVFECDVSVTMSDGAVLSANVFRPAAPGRYPVIMANSPYGKSKFEAISIFSQVPDSHIGHIRITDHVAFEAPDPGYWVPHGYVVIQADTRGQGKSTGKTSLFSPREQLDYVELIAWAAEQVWSTGAVGLNGVSYLAISQWLVAQHRPPALKAIIPWEGFNDFYLRSYFGGIPEVGFWAWVLQEWVAPAHNPECASDPGVNPADHPLKDDFWLAATPRLEMIDAPALVCGSFSDQGLHSRDSLDAFTRISSRKKWLYSHRRPKWDAYYSQEALELQRRFFDLYLKGQEDAMSGVSPVRIEISVDRENYRVHTATQWPIEGTVYTPYYLSSDALSLLSSEFGIISYSPSEEGSVAFDLRFEHDIQIVGHTKLKLWVEAEGADDMDLFAGLQKLDRDGNQVFFYGFGGTNPNDLIARGWLRASHRELDTARSTAWRPVHTHKQRQKLSPGEIVSVEIEILPSGTYFKAGETLRLVVQGQTIQPDAVLLKVVPHNRGRHIIHFGGKWDSHLLLPVLPES